jgi:electron transfer flavoprotein alpha subunit
MKKREPWRNRIVGEADVDPTTLKGHPQNWRRHPDRQRAAMIGVLGEVGWIARIIVNRTTGRVIDGHLRLEEAFRRGEKTVPVTYVELSEAEEKEALATFDPLGALAETDNAALEQLLEEVVSSDQAIQEMLKTHTADIDVFDVTSTDRTLQGGVGSTWDAVRGTAAVSCVMGSINLRVEQEVFDRVRETLEARFQEDVPYSATFTAILERGIECLSRS